MKNEYNDKDEELVRNTVNHIIANDVLLPTDILRILVGDSEYIKMLESGLLSHIIYLLDYIGRDVWMTKCINIYAKRRIDKRVYTSYREVMYTIKERLHDVLLLNDGNAKIYYTEDGLDILKDPKYKDFFDDRLFSGFEFAVGILRTTPYYLMPDMIRIIPYRVVANNMRYINLPYGERRSIYNEIEDAAGEFLENVYMQNTILDYGVMTVALSYIAGGLTILTVRDVFIRKYGYWIINQQNVTNLKEFIGNSKVLEVMAGTGYVGKILSNNGIDIISTDNNQWADHFDTIYKRDESIDCISAVKKYGKDCDVLMMSWVPFGSSIGADTMRLYHEINPNGAIIWIGEQEGGACGSDEDFEVMDSIGRNEELEKFFNYSFEQFNGMHDEAFIMDPTGKRSMTKYIRGNKALDNLVASMHNKGTEVIISKEDILEATKSNIIGEVIKPILDDICNDEELPKGFFNK